MAFRYALQPLLRLRESLERQEEQRLFGTAAIVARLRAEIEQSKEEGLVARRADQREMAIVSHGASLQFAAICEVAALHARQQLEAQLERAERKRLFQLQEYQAARQKREILQCIMQRQKEAYDLEFARHEQQTADEVFLFSFHVLSNQ